MNKLISLVILVTIVTSCSSSTLISVSDQKVKIYVDGEYRGKGSVTHTDTKIVGSSTSVILKKKGCETQRHSFSRSEVFDAGACAGGVFVLIPFLWVMKYKPSRMYEFECENN